MLRHSLQPVISCHRGAGMVEHPANVMSWNGKSPCPNTTKPPDRIRCIPQRVGSIMPRDTDRWSVVPAGETTAHKLPRAASSNTSSQNLLEGPKKQELLLDNQTAVAYVNNLGGTVSAQATKLARELWMWCLQRSDSTTSTGERECDSRQRVESIR